MFCLVTLSSCLVVVRLLILMARTKRCPGCIIPQAEHKFGKFDKQCPGPVPDEEEELAAEDDTAGHDVAPASQPVSAVSLPELRAMARLSGKADQEVAQLGLADSSVSTSDSDGDDSDLQSPLSTKAKIAHAHGGKSLKSGKEAKITSAVLYSQSWPHCYLSITHGRRDVKSGSLNSKNSLPVMARSSCPQSYLRWNVFPVFNIWFR